MRSGPWASSSGSSSPCRTPKPAPRVLGDHHRLGWVAAYLLAHFVQACDPDRALASGQRALAIAADLGDVGLTVTVQGYLGIVYRSLGDYRRAVEYSKRMWRVSTARCSRSASACTRYLPCSPAVSSSSP